MTSPGITVVGAGIVGVCCARFLQRIGFDVTLIDRLEPGAATSFGNLGMICARELSLPMPSMRLVRAVPRMLLDPDGPLVIRWRHLPQLAPWLVHFVCSAGASTRRRNARSLSSLLGRSLEAYRTILEGSGAAPLVRHEGSLIVYETDAAFAAGAADRAWLRDLGASIEEVGPGDIRDLEPALAPVFCHGVLTRDCAHTTNPGRLTRELAQDVLHAGGRVVRAEVRGAAIADGTVRLTTDHGPLVSERLVVAAGAWSAPIAAGLGFRVPLQAERGYHTRAVGVTTGLRRPITHGETNLGLTQMDDGLRIGGTVELAGLNAPPRPGRARMVYRLGRRLLADPDWDRSADLVDWMGHRPSLPDHLPVIGPSPRHRNVWFAFGHQHIGLSLAAVTGQVVADLVADRDPGIDVGPYRVDRFGL
ncbi:MAG: FAD-binding oxidoreductase [Alphaproteobacteria bacterium]|nr:FAD-binding oxidoreductase [Alphaproteobacteria bacterium]